MIENDLSPPYAPNALLGAVLKRVFTRIQVDPGWADQVRRLSETGSVLYVLPNLNWLDFLALDHLTKRHGLPPIRYVNDLGLWLLNPEGPTVRGMGLFNMLMPHRRQSTAAEFQRALERGGSACLFLKRPPSVIDATLGASGGRGLQEGDELVRAMLRVAGEEKKPIFVLPLVFLWSKSPDRLESSPVDFLLGPRAWPTPARALAQWMYNFKHVEMRMAQPIEVQDFLRTHADQSETVQVRRLVYMTLRRLERERRGMVGPAEKSPARIRAEILRSPRLRSVIADVAGPKLEDRVSKTEDAAKMLRELQATPSSDVIKGMGMALRWGFSRIYHGIDFVGEDVERVRNASRDGTLVLLPSHKSHIDYLVLSYFFYEHNLPVPLIAAGDNLNFQPVGPIFRRAGAFFIRRSFKGDRLYAAVVDAYVRRLIRDGYPIELFLEGGRSRTGKLLEPKFGMLNMIVDAVLAVPQQKVHFVPVSIGYERIIEAKSYQHELSGGEKKKEEATDLLSAGDVLRHRYGRINLQVGQILTLEDMANDLGFQASELGRPAKRRAAVMRLGNRVMDEINRVTAVTPGALTALTLLSSAETTLSEELILARAARLLAILIRLGARTTSSTTLGEANLRASSIREALQMFIEAELVVATPDASSAKGSRTPAAGRNYRVIDDSRLELDTSKNIVIHFFVERALVASSLSYDEKGQVLPTDVDVLRTRVRYASRLFKHEFRFRADASFDTIFDSTLAVLLSDGHLAQNGTAIVPGPGELGSTGAEWLDFYRRTLRPFFEGYWLTTRALEHLLGTDLSEKELVKTTLGLGKQLLESGQIRLREAVSKPLIQNALHALSEMGYLRSRADKFELVGTYQDPDALRALAEQVEAFVSGQHRVEQ
jgi:glycerol-3-phosphate O-acyltransferase